MGRRWSLGIPVAVTATVSALCLWSWASLLDEREQQVKSVAELAATQVRQSIDRRVREYAVALQNLAGSWAIVGPESLDGWHTTSAAVIESFPAIESVAWAQPDGRRYRADAKTGRASDDPLAATAVASEPSLVGPERDAEGSLGFRLLLPVRGRADPRDLGVLEARVNAPNLIDEALQQWAPGYSVTVRWGEQEIFRRGESAVDPALGRWTLGAPVALPLGATWEVTVAPTSELAEAWLTPAPDYFLAAGLVLALALGFQTRQLLLSDGRANALAASAGEVLRLNEILEARVAERTAELESWAQSFSHDLKSPLGAILNFSAILLADRQLASSPEALDILARIRRSATRAADLLDGLLRLDRARRSELDERDVDMDSLARQAFRHAQDAAGDHEIALDLALEPMPDARGDRALLADALASLFDNALKFSRGREKRTVAMRGSRVGDECVYQISDTGRGFDMQFAQKLFGVFERLHTSPELPGAGVGLALVKKIIQRHGGRVWGEGEVDVGARFTFTLPAGRAAP